MRPIAGCQIRTVPSPPAEARVAGLPPGREGRIGPMTVTRHVLSDDPVPAYEPRPGHWLRLAQRINEVFRARPDLAGIVVTHGTARLEETASPEPVVPTGPSGWRRQSAG